MIDYKAHKSEIIRAKGELMRTTNPHRKRDLRRYIGRLYKEMSEAKKWEDGTQYHGKDKRQ